MHSSWMRTAECQPPPPNPCKQPPPPRFRCRPPVCADTRHQSRMLGSYPSVNRMYENITVPITVPAGWIVSSLSFCLSLQFGRGWMRSSVGLLREGRGLSVRCSRVLVLNEFVVSRALFLFHFRFHICSSLVGDECVPEWAFSGKVGDYTAKAYGITEYIVHLLIPGALLIFFYGRLIYRINNGDSTSTTMEKVSFTSNHW